MKRFTAAALSAAMLLASVPVMPQAVIQSMTVTAKENAKFHETNFFVAVGQYRDTFAQFRYYHLNEDGTYSAYKVVSGSKAEYDYGEILTCEGEPGLSRVKPAPNDPVYANTYYYQLSDDTTLNKVGNVGDLLEQKKMTVTNNNYNGSGQYIINLTDAAGNPYTYSLNIYGSSIGFNLYTSKKGDVVKFAMYQDQPIIPVAFVEKDEDIMKGDVNGDNVIDIMDVICLNKTLLGINEVTLEMIEAADVNDSGKPDAADSLMILKYCLEMIDSFDLTVTLPVTDDAKLLAAPEYPQFPLYPSNSSSEAYEEWIHAVSNIRSQPDGYQKGFDSFFTSTAPVFLKKTEGENRVYSPLSLYMALGMTAEITDGDTRYQILNVLHQKDLETLRKNASAIWKANYMDDGMAKSLLSTSLWTNKDYTYRQETLDALATYYYASSFTGTPGTDDYDKLMQAWLNQETGGMLEDYVSQIKTDPTMIMTLASTIDYSGKWFNKFDPALNKTGTFHGASGDKTTEFMYDTMSRVYYWGEHYGAIDMKLENNGSMRLILPDEGVTPEELLGDKEVMEYLLATRKFRNSKYTKVYLTVPKFDVSSGIDLREGLESLGIKDIFDADKGDFSPLTKQSEGLFVSKAEQDARVMIDEEGCKASALTVMPIAGAALPKDDVYFTLDRPFLFEIMSETGLPLFVGIVNNVE